MLIMCYTIRINAIQIKVKINIYYFDNNIWWGWRNQRR